VPKTISKSKIFEAADKIDEATKRYHRSEKGKAALKRTQAKYYKEKRKPLLELTKQFNVWLETHSRGTMEAFIKEKYCNGEVKTNNKEKSNVT
jgi:hypothetical protein